ncbi:MAG: ArsR/SmtB family transcription factor, partial [Jeotgalicoccus sp.]
MTNKDVCEVFCYDEDKVERLQKDIETVDITGMSQMLKAVADKNRAKITYILCQDDELCVCDIALILGITIPNTSHHLRTLYKEGIVTSRKEGKLV